MGKKSDEDAAIEVFLEWAADDAQVRQWQHTINLRKLLGPRPRNFAKAARGRDSDAMLVQIKGVLPPRVAEGAAAIVARIEDGKWNTLEGDGDPAKPSLDGIRAAHRFGAVVDPSGVRGGPELLKALARMMPPAANRHASFHLGRYEEGDFLAAQDDAAFCAVDAGSKDPAKAGQIIKCSRDVAVMLFLSKNRTEAGGGLLRDLFYKHRADHKGAAYVPEFNSLVAFHVPREYEITPVLSDDPLLSVFGWYLQEGELYDLKRPDPEVEAADAAADDSKNKRERAKAARRKERAKAKKKEEQSTVPSFLRALAAEREKCRANKEFSRADVIREQCLKAGYRFNAGGKLVKVSSAAASDASKEPAAAAVTAAAPTLQDSRGGGPKDKNDHKHANRGVASNLNPTGAQSSAQSSSSAAAAASDGAAQKKKKESKAQRLQRQAKEAALAAAAGGGGQEPAESGSASSELEAAAEELRAKAARKAARHENKRKGADETSLSKRADEGERGDQSAAGGQKKRKTDVHVDGPVSEEGAGEAGERAVDATNSKHRKRGAAEEVVGGRDEGGEGQEGAREKKRSRNEGGKAGNAEKLLALSALSMQSKATPAKAAEVADAAASAPDARGGGRESAGVCDKGGNPEDLEVVKGALQKEPKKPKKAKVKQGVGAGELDVDAGGAPEEGRRGKGRDVLLARIKDKGWIRAAPAPAPAQM